MATTSETGSSLADRLMARSASTSRIGSRKGIFERFGLRSPYEGGAVSDPSDPDGSAGRAGVFSFLSSRSYFEELRGLSKMRGKLLYRISGMRQKIRVGEAIRTSIATESTRAAMLDRYDPTFIDWSTQLDLEELGIEEPADAVAVAAARYTPRRRRPSAAERALRARITEASDTLQQLQSLARVAVGDARKSVAERRARSISALPSRRQPAAARQLTRKLRGTQAAAARGTSLNAGATEAGSVGTRPLAVASARDSFFAPKGLRRVTEDSPIVMTLEQPESQAPEAEPEQTVQRASRRPAIRPRAHRRVPVAPVAREARNQADAGRAGPPVQVRAERRADPLALSRPTERIARSMRLEQATPLTDTRRGLEAAYRSTPEADQASQSLERRIAIRGEAGLPDASGRVVNTTGYVAADRSAGRRLTQTAEGRIASAPRTASLVDSVPAMAPIQHAGEPEMASVEATADADQPVSSRPVTREPRRSRVHRTPASQTQASKAVRTPSSRTVASDAVRTAPRSPATRRSLPTVRRALPPMARAIHRSEPVAAAPTSRVAISRTPVDGRAFSPGVDRRSVGVSRQLAAAVAREAMQRTAPAQRASVAAPGFVMASPVEVAADVPDTIDDTPDAPTQFPAGIRQSQARAGSRQTRASGRSPTQRLSEQASEAPPTDRVASRAESRERVASRRTEDAPVRVRAVDPDAEMRVAVPVRGSDTAQTGPTESAQRAIASGGPSRRSRALPTVRAASRALAQERLGARGRLLSPSSTAHVDVTDPGRALDAAPLARGLTPAVAARPMSARIDAAQMVYAQSADDTADDTADDAPSEAALADTAPADTAAARPRRVSAVRSRRAVVEPESTRLGPVARATERSGVERVGLSGELLAPRAVARFDDHGIIATAADAMPTATAADVMSTDRMMVRSSQRLERGEAPPVARAARISERVAPTPLTLALPEVDAPSPEGEVASSPRPGLASRASDRVERSRSGRRSVLPAPTPEVVRARSESQEQARTGASQPVRTESGRVVPSRTVRTESTPVERSIGWRTPRSYHARTVAMRTDSGTTEASAAFRTETGVTARSTAFRTATGQDARLASSAPALTPLTDQVGPVSVEEIDPEGAVVRASRRMDVRRNAVSDSAVTHLSHAPQEHVGSSDVSAPQERALERERRAGQSRRAIGRSAVRQGAGSVVPHPVGSDATDRAVTRMLAGPEQVYAAPEDVVLNDGIAMPGDTLRSRPVSRVEGRTARLESRASQGRASEGAGPIATRESRPTAHLADGMTLAAPVQARAEEALESIAGGRRAVSPRPGAPSRSRLQQAMRAATTAAASRATETVLTLPSPQRQLAPEPPAGSSDSSSRPRYQVRLSVDESGRVLRASAIDSTTGTRMALPESAIEARVQRVESPTMTSALPVSAPGATAGATEWAETRGRRANQTVSRRRGADRRARTMQDAGGTYVQRPGSDTVGVDVAGGPLFPGYAQADLRFAGLDNTLDVLAGPDDTQLGARLGARTAEPGSPGRRPMLRRRTWQRRSAAAELGTIAPVLADAEYSDAPEVPSDSPSWARRAVTGTSAGQRDAEESQAQASANDDWSPNSLMGALVRAERAEDLVQVILERGREVASLREALPNEAVRMVETIAGLDPEDVAVLRSRSRIIRPGQLPGASGSSRTRASRSRKGSPDLHQLSTAKEGVGANKITKLADKLMNLIHLAEHARSEARSNVRMAEDSNEARAEGGARVPGMSVEDGDMNLDALYKSVLDSTMEYFEELDSRREDPDGRNKWW